MSLRNGAHRLAIVVSHPIQYYVPLYRRLAQRDEFELRVFFTWHDGSREVHDTGFRQTFSWDLPLSQGFDFELVKNLSRDPGTHHFRGLINPSLPARVLAWSPDSVHITGWAWESHLRLLRALPSRAVPTFFRGDSHLIGVPRHGVRWLVKRLVLSRVYSWPTGFLVVGSASRAYYKAFGVPDEKLFHCPHSIDVSHFAEPDGALEAEAQRWRGELGIRGDQKVLLFAGKLEPKKQPLMLARAVMEAPDEDLVLVVVGSGELESELKGIAGRVPGRMRLLPFQNQSRMPVVYRLCDLFVLPSAFGETWGLAVNESLASGRPVLMSDRVGCSADVADEFCARVFRWDDPGMMMSMALSMLSTRDTSSARRAAAKERAHKFDLGVTEDALVRALLKRSPS